MIEKDRYKTLSKPSQEVLYKDKNSKFFGYAFPVKQEADVKNVLEALKTQHQSAGHWCYAYQTGTNETNLYFRTNDDGEPNNSAGMPIYGQIQSFNLTNTLVVVVRYFGGVKLGVGGLINAYKTTAKLALEASKIINKTIKKHYCIHFEYKNMNKVMRIIKENNLKIVSQTLELDCQITISIRLRDSEKIAKKFKSIYGVSIKTVD